MNKVVVTWADMLALIWNLLHARLYLFLKKIIHLAKIIILKAFGHFLVIGIVE